MKLKATERERDKLKLKRTIKKEEGERGGTFGRRKL